MEIPYSVEELDAAVVDTVSVNGLAECYIRPIAYVGYGELGVNPGDNPVDVSVLTWPWGAYLGEDGQTHGITAKVSSWKRVGPNTIPHAAKATGIYLNSMLATTEAKRAGYDEAIMLTDEGMIADGPGESIFVVKNGKISTPDIAADLGYELQERQMIRSELYLADEIFMTGTAAEIVPLRSVDDIAIGEPGPVTREIQKAYGDAVRGHTERWAHWLEYVPRIVARA
jgi:branched-chain amino acid aminotransferase